jgi:membrane-bound serine protease (ClpP class)
LWELPLNYTGLILVFLGLTFMIAEAFVPSLGALGVGGIVAFVVGAAMLTDTDVPEFQVSWTVIGTMAAISAAFLILMIGYLVRVRRSAVLTGAEHMVGAEAVVIDWAGSHGHVWTQGERWEARGEGPFVTGQALRILRVEHLTLLVTAAPAESGGSEA